MARYRMDLETRYKMREKSRFSLDVSRKTGIGVIEEKKNRL